MSASHETPGLLSWNIWKAPLARMEPSESLSRIHVPRKGWNLGSLSCFSTTCQQPAALCSAYFLGNNCWLLPAVGVAYLHLFILPPIRCWPEERLATPECAHKRFRANFIPISYVAQTWVNQNSDPNPWKDESQNLKNRDCSYFGSFFWNAQAVLRRPWPHWWFSTI